MFIEPSQLHQYVYTALVSILNKLREMNQRFQITVRIVNAVEASVMFLLRLDSHLDLHQSVSEIGWTVWEALLKAAIAYAQTSSANGTDKHAIVIKAE